MNSRKFILSIVSIMTIGALGAGTVQAKVTDKQVAEVAQRNFKMSDQEDARVAIVMYVKDEVKDGVVYEVERPVKVFNTRKGAEDYVKANQDVHQYKRGLYTGELRIRESYIDER